MPVFEENCMEIETFSSHFKVITLIGVTGQGKSSVGNSICGEKKFYMSPGSEAQTTCVKGVITNFNGDP